MNLHSVGSGFIISEDGYILTNNHVIDNTDNISVYLNNTEYNAELIGADEYQDIALLKIRFISPASFVSVFSHRDEFPYYFTIRRFSSNLKI
jgi:serine protease Do